MCVCVYACVRVRYVIIIAAIYIVHNSKTAATVATATPAFNASYSPILTNDTNINNTNKFLNEHLNGC